MVSGGSLENHQREVVIPARLTFEPGHIGHYSFAQGLSRQAAELHTQRFHPIMP